MKLNKKLVLLLALLLLVSIVGGIFLTNAKYTSTETGTITSSVAQWTFNVSATDSYRNSDTLENLTLAQTVDSSTLVNGKIAPGTSGSFDIVVNAQGSEVGINYTVSFANNTKNSLPTNLKFTLDGSSWNLSDSISGTIDANASNKTVIHTIAWSWDYETANGDTADTLDGTNAFDYSFAVTATGTQVRPVAQ